MNKTIKIVDAEGNPLAGAHVMPENGIKTISNSAGVANVEVSNQETWVEITHVSGASTTMPFFDLTNTVTLGANELDTVEITAKKKSNLKYWIAAMAFVAIVAANAKNKPVKVKL